MIVFTSTCACAPGTMTSSAPLSTASFIPAGRCSELARALPSSVAVISRNVVKQWELRFKVSGLAFVEFGLSQRNVPFGKSEVDLYLPRRAFDVGRSLYVGRTPADFAYLGGIQPKLFVALP